VQNNHELAVGILLTALVTYTDTASAQYCDPRYDPDCHGTYRQPQPPQPPFPFFLFPQPRDQYSRETDARDPSRDPYGRDPYVRDPYRRDPYGRDPYAEPDEPPPPPPYRRPTPPRESYAVRPPTGEPYEQSQEPPPYYYGRPPTQPMPQPARPDIDRSYERPSYGQPYEGPYDQGIRRQYASLYSGVPNERFPIPAVDLSQVAPEFLRTTVMYPNGEAPGTIVVDPRNHFLYFVEGGGRAIRYGVGVGRQGFGWSGVATIHNKQEWPSWYPPRDMFKRQPELMQQMSELEGGPGMPGGPRNPLGSRAMYLWQGDHDTLYRIHGTTEPWTIGKSVSSGCIRMINQDVIDLYARAQVGTRVVVLQ
jgi:lipoprotein-anchoring transpeptidase ErfK/SrfK